MPTIAASTAMAAAPRVLSACPPVPSLLVRRSPRPPSLMSTSVATEPKTGKSRRAIHLSPDSERVLRAIRLRQREDRLKAGSVWVQTDYVFTTETREPCDPGNALRALKAAAKSAGLPGVGLHTLRHSAATVMLENRVPLKVVSEILGHSSVSITGDVYGYVSPDVSAQAMDAVGVALSGGTE